MLSILASLLALTPPQACPDLSGAFLCRANSFHPDIVYEFSRSAREPGWEYAMRSRLPESERPLTAFRFLADGQERTVTDEVSGKALRLRAQCEGDVLRVTGTSGPVRFAELLSLTPEGDLLDISDDLEGTPYREVCARR